MPMRSQLFSRSPAPRPPTPDPRPPPPPPQPPAPNPQPLASPILPPHHTVRDGAPLEARKPQGNIRRPRYRQDHLPHGVASSSEHVQNRARASFVELRKRIVEQQHRSGSSPEPQRASLENPQRDRGRPLLPR